MDSKIDLDSWVIGYVLPNIDVVRCYGNELVRILPANDSTLKTLISGSSNLRRFLGSFKDEFGVRVRPSLMIYSKEAPRITGNDMEALASFRDILAISGITKGWTRVLGWGAQHQVLYSEAFDYYPWRLDKDLEYLIALTPAITGVHLVEEFRGQVTPALPVKQLTEPNVDMALHEALLEVWKRRFCGSHRSRQDAAILRSLRMAYAAARLPGGADSTHLDFGRQVALWVSAFEILVHPKRNHANANEVCEVLRETPWVGNRFRKKAFSMPYGLKKDNKYSARNKISLPEWIYRNLSIIRNDYLHGNEIDASELIIRRIGKCYHHFAAPLYRAAIASVLRMSWVDGPNDGQPFSDEWLRYHEETRSLRMEQSFNEEALLASRSRSKRTRRG